jgi:hypothetical protein
MPGPGGPSSRAVLLVKRAGAETARERMAAGSRLHTELVHKQTAGLLDQRGAPYR